MFGVWIFAFGPSKNDSLLGFEKNFFVEVSFFHSIVLTINENLYKPSFLLKVIIRPTEKKQQLYINYKNSIHLCPFQECMVCFDEKYVKKICNNNHYCCFSCKKVLKRYNTKICPMCRENLTEPV